jgi:Uroporphyrinogen-III decarboxylase
MTSKERMMIALNLGKPDRVPATIHQWQEYHLKYYMGGISDMEAFSQVGLDASITRFPLIQRDSNQWRVTSTSKKVDDYVMTDELIETPGGSLTHRYGYNEITTWDLDHMIKKDEDIYLIKKYRPLPLLDRKKLQEDYELLGDEGILRTFTIGSQGGCWQDACCLYGTEEMIYATYDKPEWVHEFLGILLEQKLRFIEESLKGAKADLVETGGGAASNNVISPDLHKEFCMPYDRQIHEALKGIGFKTVYHTCGGMTKILDHILNNGCNASETLSPVGVGGDITDPSVVFDKYTGKLAMIGGLDQFGILTDGTKETITKEVHRLFDGFGSNGGYIMSASDHFFVTPKENLRAFAEAAKECRY